MALGGTSSEPQPHCPPGVSVAQFSKLQRTSWKLVLHRMAAQMVLAISGRAYWVNTKMFDLRPLSISRIRLGPLFRFRLLADAAILNFEPPPLTLIFSGGAT